MTERIAYRADEAAEALGLDIETVRRALARGELPTFHPPGTTSPDCHMAAGMAAQRYRSPPVI